MTRPVMHAALLLLAFGAPACQLPPPLPPPPAIHAQARMVDLATRLPRAGVTARISLTVRMPGSQVAVPDVKTVSDADGIFRFDLADPTANYKLELTLPDCRSKQCRVCASPGVNPRDPISRFCHDMSAADLERDYKDPSFWALDRYGDKHWAKDRDGQLDLGDLFVIDEQQVVDTYSPVCARLASGAPLKALPVSDGKGSVVLINRDWRVDLSSMHAAEKWNLVCVASKLERVGVYRKTSGEESGDAFDRSWRVAAVRKDGQVFRTEMGVGAAATVASAASGSMNQLDELDKRLITWLRETGDSAAR